MSESLRRPRLWSDFDGTGVELVPKTNPRNWSKYPLRAIDGYVDFLRGVRDGGVEIAGVVSRRPAIRKWVTARSIAKLGMDEVFPGAQPFVLAGSEDRKADFVANQSRFGKVGMIDDKPHKFGASLLRSLDASDGRPDGGRQTVIVGAVDHDKTGDYVDRFLEMAHNEFGIVPIKGEAGSHIVPSGNFIVHIVTIEPYSFEAGQAFAETLHRTN